MEARSSTRQPATEQPPGPATGELWCKGPNVMAGYLGDPEATAETLDHDGWLHTGDLATVTDGRGISRSSTGSRN